MSDRAGHLTFFCGLLVIAGLGAAGRLWQINESLWLDELHTSWVVSDTFDEIAPRARIGNQSPVYFYVVRLSTLAFGDNELALRMPSLVAGIGLVVAVGYLTWRWSGVAQAGWLAAALVAVDHNMIFFSQEARPYALVQVIALIQLVAFWRLQSTHCWRSRLIVVGGWIVMFHLHYTAILLLVGEMSWWMVIQFWQRGKGGYRPRQVMFDVGLTAVSCAVAWPHLADIATRRSMWEMFIFQKPSWVALRWFHWDLYVLSSMVLCVGLTVLACWWQRVGFARRPGDEAGIKAELPAWLAVVPLIVFWWSAPVVVAWSLTASDLARVFFPRYLIGIASAPMICAGLCVAMCRGERTRTVAMVGIVALAVYGNGLWGQFLRDGRLISDRRQDWRGAVTWLNEVRDDAAPVLVRSGLIEADRLRADSSPQLGDYCCLPVTSLYSIKPPVVVVPLPTSRTGRLSDEVVRLVQQHGGAWLVVSARPASHEALRGDLRESFQGEQLEFLREKSFGNVAVWQVKSSHQVKK